MGISSFQSGKIKERREREGERGGKSAARKRVKGASCAPALVDA